MNQTEIRQIKKYVTSLWPATTQGKLYLSDEACLQFFENIKKSPLSNKHFYLAVDTYKLELTFQLYLNRFFEHKQHWTIKDFFDQVHPDYLESYLLWAKSIYTMMAAHPEYMSVIDVSYKIMIPLRNAEGKYYWVLQEAYILQLDEYNNPISHFNTYTVVGKYETPQEIYGWLSSRMEVDVVHDVVLKRFYNQISNFKLSEREKQLVLMLTEKPNMQYKEICSEWDIKEDTVKKHAQSIIDKSKIAFPNFFKKNEPVTLKNVVNYLSHLEYKT